MGGASHEPHEEVTETLPVTYINKAVQVIKIYSIPNWWLSRGRRQDLKRMVRNLEWLISLRIQYPIRYFCSNDYIHE